MKPKDIELGASILNVDSCYIGEAVEEAINSNIDFIHVDIMDGKFVENITWGPRIIADIKMNFDVVTDVHLMIEKPEQVLLQYLNASPDRVSIHPESTYFSRKLLHQIKSAGVEAGVAMKLETPIDSIVHLLDIVDFVLLLSSEEGFGGNSYSETIMNSKVSRIMNLKKSRNYEFKIQLDGGIKIHNIKALHDEGVNRFVLGSALYNNDTFRMNYEKLINALQTRE